MVNPGAPGFVYTFHAKKDDSVTKRPLIAVAGDCADSAYIYRPSSGTTYSNKSDPSTQYKLMAEIACDATVGSIAIGYDDFHTTEQERGFAKMYIPCFEKDKILVLALGSGEYDEDDW